MDAIFPFSRGHNGWEDRQLDYSTWNRCRKPERLWNRGILKVQFADLLYRHSPNIERRTMYKRYRPTTVKGLINSLPEIFEGYLGDIKFLMSYVFMMSYW